MDTFHSDLENHLLYETGFDFSIRNQRGDRWNLALSLSDYASNSHVYWLQSNEMRGYRCYCKISVCL
jgi:hypothetical protein